MWERDRPLVALFYVYLSLSDHLLNAERIIETENTINEIEVFEEDLNHYQRFAQAATERSVHASGQVDSGVAEIKNLQTLNQSELVATGFWSSSGTCTDLRVAVTASVSRIAPAQADLKKFVSSQGKTSMSKWDVAWMAQDAGTNVLKLWEEIRAAQHKSCPWLTNQDWISPLKDDSKLQEGKKRIQEVLNKYNSSENNNKPLNEQREAAAKEIMEAIIEEVQENKRDVRRAPLKTEAYKSLFPSRLRALMDEEANYWAEAQRLADVMAEEEALAREQENLAAQLKRKLCQATPDHNSCTPTTTSTTEWKDMAPKYTYALLELHREYSGDPDDDELGGALFNTFILAIAAIITIILLVVVIALALVTCGLALVSLVGPVIGLIWCVFQLAFMRILWALGWLSKKPEWSECMDVFMLPWTGPKGPNLVEEQDANQTREMKTPFALANCAFGLDVPGRFMSGTLEALAD